MMTRQEHEAMIINEDIKNIEKQMASQVEWLMRQAEEMKQGVERGYDLGCHANNVSSAATELAIMAARLDSLKRIQKTFHEAV
jgi:malonyl CoA-acyl carrier protein transacylase